MYHNHFKLREEPFGVSPDRRFFFETEQHVEALATLSYAVRQRRGFALLTGPAGSGKTSILVQLCQSLVGAAEVAYLPHPYYDRDTVFENILLCFDLKPVASQAQNYRTFYRYMLEQQRSGKTSVLILDEAQDLDASTLETIRTLSNFELPSEKLVQIILCGQHELTQTLSRPNCNQLRQRLNVIARLLPMTKEKVSEYIAYRVKRAGGSANLFSPEAVEAIADASQGVPRNVNTICFNALSIAYALERQNVALEHVCEARKDLELTSESKFGRVAI